MNFWASYCIPACVDEHPVLAAAHERYGDELEIVGVLYSDEPGDAEGFLARYGDAGYPHLVDPDGRLAIEFGVTGPPESYFVDADGILRAKQFGPLTDANDRSPGHHPPEREPMRTWMPAAALGGLLAVVALAALLALQPRAEPTAAERVDEISRGLRCPDCQGLSVADSPTAPRRRSAGRSTSSSPMARRTRRCATTSSPVTANGSCSRPRSPVVWVLPFAVVLAGAAALGAWLLARRRALAPAPAAVLTAEERRRVHEEAEALDA